MAQQDHKCVTVNVTGCGFDPYSKKLIIYLNLFVHSFALVSRKNAALSSAIQLAMSPDFGGKYETECLSTIFPLRTQLVTDIPNTLKILFNK